MWTTESCSPVFIQLKISFGANQSPAKLDVMASVSVSEKLRTNPSLPQPNINPNLLLFDCNCFRGGVGAHQSCSNPPPPTPRKSLNPENSFNCQQKILNEVCLRRIHQMSSVQAFGIASELCKTPSIRKFLISQVFNSSAEITRNFPRSCYVNRYLWPFLIILQVARYSTT